MLRDNLFRNAGFKFKTQLTISLTPRAGKLHFTRHLIAKIDFYLVYARFSKYYFPYYRLLAQ